MLRGKTVLIISPHPDDEAICCGGLIMLAKRQNAKVFVLYMAIGSSRQFLSGQTSSRERIEEIKKASGFGNFAYKIAYKGRAFMRMDQIPQKDLIEIIEDTSEEYKPYFVCIPNRFSFDQDHRAVATACITAFRPLPQALRHQPAIILECEEPYSWSIQSSFQLNWYFDITEVLDEKIALLQCHKTQLRNDPFPRSPENLKRLAGLRGCDISTTYAEGYSLLRGKPI